MKNKKKLPFKQKTLGDGQLLREFSEATSDEELAWHRDRKDREVTVINGNGWYLQLDNMLPEHLEIGNTYKIPAREYHRLVKTEGCSQNLTIIIKEN